MKERKPDPVVRSLPSPAPAPANPCERLRRAKIICTIGPACDSEEMIRDLMRMGMDVARLNFSHGTHPEHAQRIQRLRRAARQLKRTVCILQDLQGPKIRTGRLKDGKHITLKTGSMLTITPRKLEGTAVLISTDFAGLAREVEPGARILLSDGRIELKVRSIRGDDVECEVLNGGRLGQQQGINLPGAAVAIPALTAKDKLDLQFGLKYGVDVVALSFVRSADDIREAKSLMRQYGKSVPIIAKLEKPQAIERLEEILEIANGVMIARGDLGVEVPPEKVPAIQKYIIRRASEYSKPVITATQMLESMIENPRPTRAEVSDVANAIYDGTDAVMLSGESAVGKYPVESVEMMARIVTETERHMRENLDIAPRERRSGLTIAETICEATAHAADDLDLRGIALFTESGATARQLSKYHPTAPIFALSPLDVTVNRLNLLWGTTPIRCPKVNSTEALVDCAETLLEKGGYVRPREVIAIVAGTRTKSGSTNFLRLHAMGENSLNGLRFRAPRAEKPAPAAAAPKKRRAATASKTPEA